MEILIGTELVSQMQNVVKRVALPLVLVQEGKCKEDVNEVLT